MQALPLIVGLAVAVAISPPLERALAQAPLARKNYRGAVLACPLGLVVVAAALLALIPLALLQQAGSTTVLRPELGWAAIYVLGVAVLGLADDALGGDAAAGAPRGWREHARAALRGEPGTGALKALGSAGLALYVMASLAPGTARFLLGAGVLVLATNAFNLLDLRPGRAAKAFVTLGAGLTIGSGDAHPLWALGLFAGPVLVVGARDLREHGLLGDTGANLIGALAGAWLVLTLSTAGLAVAFLVLAALTAYGEFRSISAFVERNRLLRRLDSWGRATDV